ncbi:o-methyltransferase [Colletotrichum truncatum]|uniref:O-methyltransferase n=1 Tax=Colletotrichum truncatum TaxID=5467 RepID=A0ACC3YLG4_COLTU|nr:o-methyltransferase [Colletotrichum truncatum]KAF6782637.1 o-methyltransferase [Colletotrichum truncatum]
MTTRSESFENLAFQLSEIAKSSSSEAEMNTAAAVIARDILKVVRGTVPDWSERMFSAVEVTALRLFLDWGAFEAIPDHGTISFTMLAKQLNADESLVRRTGWVLVAGGVLRQHGKDQVAHTTLSRQYLPGSPDGLLLEMIFDEHMLPALKLPEYFLQYGRHEPVSRTHTPHSFALGQPDKEIWEIQKGSPHRVKRMMKAMELTESFIPMVGIYDFSWVKTKLSENQDRIILVDVGGGKGHVVKAILNENSFIPPERIILEDRDEVIDEVMRLKEPELSKVQLRVHDFHQPQPVKGAMIYSIRRCLHDYGDEVCVKMLAQISEAMASDSKLLIGEYVLPNPPSALGAMSDFAMMGIGGKERTADDWEALVAHAGLKIEKVHGLDKKIQVIECTKTEVGI